MKKITFVFVLTLLTLRITAQWADFNLNSYGEKFIERQDILDRELSTECFTDIKPYDMKKAQYLFDESLKHEMKVSRNDSFNREYFRNENIFLSGLDIKQRKGILKTFYRSKRNFFQVGTTDFNVSLNPVFHFYGGIESGYDDLIYTNSRGVELQGNIDNRVGFYTFLTDNQSYFPTYFDSFEAKNQVFPGLGFKNDFKDGAYDYFIAKGYIDAKISKHINIQLGHGKNFIGNGYRSLLLSDFAKDYFYLKISTQVWKFKYQNLFTEFVNAEDQSLNPYKKKYGAFHYLSINLFKQLRIGLFEAIIFNSESQDRVGYELNYLNPIIFYRSIERDLGSPDNAFVGMNLVCYPVKSVSLYGQLLLDEFVLEELKAGDGWWANKYGIQAGAKYLNIFTIKNLDWQFEYNTVRPYTYSHEFSGSNYAHFNQSLAHPLGANFKEFINIINFQFARRFTANLRWTYATFGVDDDSTNWGGDILKSYKSRESEYGNTIAQGLQTHLNSIALVISCQIMHNAFIDIIGLMRQTNCIVKELNTKSELISIAFRMNIPYKILDF